MTGPGSLPAPARPIVLIGMMGAGKSTVGRLLAQQLQRSFIDADRELEARCGVTIPVMFEIEGEAAFRAREAALLDELSLQPGIVLATGGGAVLRADTRERLRARALVLYLRAAGDEIYRRTRRDTQRPLLQTADPRGRIEALLLERDPLYAETAHLVFQSAAANPRRLVSRILEHPLLQAAAGAAPADS